MYKLQTLQYLYHKLTPLGYQLELRDNTIVLKTQDYNKVIHDLMKIYGELSKVSPKEYLYRSTIDNSIRISINKLTISIYYD